MPPAIPPIRQVGVVTPDTFVVQANALARSRYGATTNIHGLRLLAVAIAKIDREVDFFNSVSISPSELREIFPSYRKTKNLSSFVSDATDRIMGIRAETWNDHGDWEKVNVIADARFQTGKGGLTITFHPDMQRFLLKLSGSYTRYQLRAIAQLSNPYQFHLFQFLRSYLHHGIVAMTVEDLRQLFDLGKTEYARFKDLKRRVLEPAVAAITELTDIVVTLEARKRGKFVHQIEFRVSQKDSVLSTHDRAAVVLLIAAGLTAKAAKDAVVQLKPMPCIRILAYAKLRAGLPPRAGKKGVDSPSAYLASLLMKASIAIPETPDFTRRLAATMDEFRDAFFEELEPIERKRWLDEFSKTLEGRNRADFDRFGAPETQVLKHLFRAFMREHINPENPRFRLST